ncbi:MAG: hypothetical protein ACTHY9_06640 [Sphingobacterium sp.]
MNLKNIALKDLSIYKNQTQTYIGRGDGYLSVLEGEDVYLVNDILSILSANKEALNYDELREEITKKHEVEVLFFESIIDWLKSNGIILVNEEKKGEVEILKLAIVGIDEEENGPCSEKLQAILGDTVKIEMASINDAEIDLVILFSPILNKNITKYAEELYQNKIPHIYLDYSPYTITLGPAVIPAIKTPCLKCFMKRRLANTSDPKNYLKLIRIDNEVVAQTSFVKSNYHNTLLEWLGGEILRLMGSEWKSAGIVAKAKSINFATDELEVSKIIKTVNCQVCNPHQVFRALNG